MIEPEYPRLSIQRQCALVSISRSAFYYQPAGETPLNLALMRLIDQAKLSVASGTSQITAEFDFDGRKARFDIGMGGLPNPWTTTLLQGFHCPGRSG